MIVAVGSTNPTKIEPVQKVFSHHFGSVQVRGVSVVSGVSEQPMSDEEMYRGAVARAQAALDKVSDAEYGVGIEGGLDQRTYGWFEKSIVAIADRQGAIGIGSSGGLILPERVIDRITRDGKNLEEAVDEIFGTVRVGEGIGMFGLFTNEVVTRSEGVRHGVAFALARFLHKDLYEV